MMNKVTKSAPERIFYINKYNTRKIKYGIKNLIYVTILIFFLCVMFVFDFVWYTPAKHTQSSKKTDSKKKRKWWVRKYKEGKAMSVMQCECEGRGE